MRSMALASIFTLLAGAGAALGQATGPALGVPPNEQEPRPGVVQEREQAAGIRPNPGQSATQQQTVDQLYRELMGNSTNAPTGPAALPGLGNPRQEAREEDRLYRELMGSSPSAPVGPVPLPGLGNPRPEARTEDRLYRELMGSNPGGPTPPSR